MAKDIKEQKQQKKGLKRNTIDKYYTKPSVVELCINLVKEHLTISKKNDLVIEPSAGNGAFLDGIKALAKNTLFYDIAPEENANKDIKKQDYLEWQLTDADKYKKIHVIGNPPFGRQSSLAIKFIKKSCAISDSVSFILPKSFKKDSLKKSFPLNFHLRVEIDLPKNAFMVNEEEHDVPCVFQIWEKKDVMRTVIVKLEPQQFTFVKKTDDPDISYRRVGVNAGVIDTETAEKSVQSHYFIKFANGKPVEETIEKLRKINYEFNNTVGPKSISKQELIMKFNPLL